MNSAALYFLALFFFCILFSLFHSHHFNYRRTHKSSGDTNQYFLPRFDYRSNSVEMKMKQYWLAAISLKTKEKGVSHQKIPMIALRHEMTIRKIYGNRLFLIAFSATFFSLFIKWQCTSNYVTYRTLIRVLTLTLIYMPFQNWTSIVCVSFFYWHFCVIFIQYSDINKFKHEWQTDRSNYVTFALANEKKTRETRGRARAHENEFLKNAYDDEWATLYYIQSIKVASIYRSVAIASMCVMKMNRVAVLGDMSIFTYAIFVSLVQFALS